MTTPAIVSGTAVTAVGGDGQRLIAVAVEYDAEIDGRGLTPEMFSVEHRRIQRVGTSSGPAVDAQRPTGRFVIIELAADDAAAATWRPIERDRPLLDERGAPRGPRVGDDDPTGVLQPARARFTQCEDVVAVDGSRIPGDATAVHETDRAADPLLDRFEQHEWTDPTTGVTLRYNLFIPPDRRPGDRLPLVLFLHDAGAIAVDTRAALAQGLGAVVWTSPSEQARHPCIVLAPQYDSVVVDDRYAPAAAADATRNLLEHVTVLHGVDARRRYVTGQSMGAMIALGLAIADPALFAAILVVGGQWPAAQVAPLVGTPLWVVVSEGDLKAFPEQSAAMTVLASAGADVDRASLDARSGAALDAAVEELAGSSGTVKYSTFLPGTVDRLGRTDPLSEHTSTWRVAYGIRPIRDWLMRQQR